MQRSTHNHKRAGAVVLLESTATLGKVLDQASGDEFWVKLSDLTQVAEDVIVKSKSDQKRLEKNRLTASPNSQYRIVRVA